MGQVEAGGMLEGRVVGGEAVVVVALSRPTEAAALRCSGAAPA